MFEEFPIGAQVLPSSLELLDFLVLNKFDEEDELEIEEDSDTEWWEDDQLYDYGNCWGSGYCFIFISGTLPQSLKHLQFVCSNSWGTTGFS